MQRYHWPTHIARPGDGPYSTFHPHLKYSSRYHGTNMLFANAIPKMQALRHSVAAGRVAAPHAYVFLQGANDAARDVLAAATARVAAFIADLKQGLANGTLAQPTPMVWITRRAFIWVGGWG